MKRTLLIQERTNKARFSSGSAPVCSPSLRCRRGLSLVEIVTVLVVLSLLALFVAPDLNEWQRKMDLKDSLDTLLADLQKAKMHAIKTNVSVTFEWINGTGSVAAKNCQNWRYRIKETVSGTYITDNPVTLPENICITANSFVANEGFTSRGLPLVAGGGTISLQHDELPDIRGDITQTVAGGLRLDIFKETSPGVFTPSNL